MRMAKVECKSRVSHGDTKFQPGDVIPDMNAEHAEALAKAGYVKIIEFFDRVVEEVKEAVEDVKEFVEDLIDGEEEEDEPAESDTKPVKKSRFNRAK